jgi:hypothetical protein
MEYVFGTVEDVEVLRTKGSTHTSLTGFHEVEQSYPDQVITDRFRVVRKLSSTEDQAGNCYDRYEIDSHYRVVDKTGPVAEQAKAAVAAVENAVCEMDESTEDRLAAIEEALCELDEAMEGGKDDE